MTTWKTLLAAPAALGAVIAISSNAVAAESVAVDTAAEATSEATSNFVTAEPVQLAQVTSVSELSDVQPTDWAFTALQRLVEEYGCLEGFPDRTYRGNRPLTRYEFAAGLNACLDVVIQLIGEGSELDTIKRLQEEFAAELATIRGRVDTLETDVAELEANQFSTTTKLRGQLDAHLIVPFDDTDLNDDDFVPGDADDLPSTGRDGTVGGDEASATFEYRARLNFDTSFTGEDRLRIRLQASDDAGSLANTENGLANQSGNDGMENNVKLDDVYYSFPVGRRINGIIAANSVATDDFVSSTIVPFDGPSVADAGGPEFYDLYDGGNFGAGANIAFSDNLVLDLGYSSDNSNINNGGGGIGQNGSYIAQLNLLTDGFLNAAVTYIGATDPEDGAASNSIAGLLNFSFGNFQVGGYYAANDIEGGGDADSYMGGIAIADFLGAGNNLGVYGGISPSENRDPLLVEAYYEIAVNEFFTFTPAVIYADNDGDDDNTDNIYGALRASFRF
ncbi:MAG: iron uptake porin [Phormidesmis sp.]